MTDDKLPRLGLFIVAPLLAITLIAANAIGAVIEANERVRTSEAVSAYSRQAAEILDRLQGERANAAVVLRGANETARQQYQQHWAETEALIEEMFDAAGAQSPDQRAVDLFAFNELEDALTGREVLRTAVLERSITLEQGFASYSAIIMRLIEALAEEFSRHNHVAPNFAEAFVLISTLHERVAIEAGTGLTAFFTGRIDREAHEIFISSISAQEYLAARFGALAGPDWRSALNTVLSSIERSELEAARSALISGGYSADQAVDQAHRAWWRETRLPVYFALGALRNRYAEEGLEADVQTARRQRTEVSRNALLQILALLTASVASLYGLISLIRPLDDPEQA